MELYAIDNFKGSYRMRSVSRVLLYVRDQKSVRYGNQYFPLRPREALKEMIRTHGLTKFKLDGREFSESDSIKPFIVLSEPSFGFYDLGR